MGLLDIFRAKAEPKVIAPPSFFASDVASTYQHVTYEAFEKAWRRSFPRTISDVKVIDNRSGTALPATDSKERIAFDEQYQDLTNAKLANSGALDGGVPWAQMEWYMGQGFIGYQTCALIAQNWLVDKAITMPARDAVRHGWEYAVLDGKEISPKTMDQLTQLDKKFKLKQNLAEFIRFGRMFGIRHLLFEVESNDPEYYFKPFNIDGVTPGSYKGMSQIDPYWITPELDIESSANPASRRFYEPTWWRVNGQRVHHTHFVINRNGDELADILKPAYYYGGIPVPQKIAQRVFAAERTADEAPQLALTKRSTVLKCDTTKVAADANPFIQKMIQWTQWLNNFGIKVIDGSEEIEQYDTSLQGFDETIMSQYQLVAAASDIPATKLLGTSPKGFGAAGDYEIESYHEMLESLQENDLSPVVNRHVALVIKSELRQNFRCEANWKPVDTPTAKELAEINKIKADTDMTYVTAGALDGTDIRERLCKTDDSGYNGIAEIVPGGPGDREAQQAEEEGTLESGVQQVKKSGGGDK